MQTGTGKRCNGQTRVPNHQVGAVPTKERASAQGPQVHLGPQQQNFAVDKPLEQLHFGFAGLPVAAGLVRQQRFGLGYPRTVRRWRCSSVRGRTGGRKKYFPITDGTLKGGTTR